MIIQPTLRDVLKFAPPPLMGDGFGALFPKSGVASPYYPVGADCVLYHDYGDGLESAVDHSIYGNDGTVMGATFVENGLSFDGIDDYVSLVLSDSLKLRAGDWTFLAWINWQIKDSDAAIVSFSTDTPPWYDLLFGMYTNKRIRSYLFLNTYGGKYVVYDDATTIEENTWGLLGWTLDRDVGSEAFLNGVSIKGPEGVLDAMDITTWNRYLYIGKTDSYIMGGNFPYKGIIGKLFAFNTIKTVADQLDIFNFTKARYE